MRFSGQMLLRHYGLAEQMLNDVDLDRAYTELAVAPELHGAIVTIKVDALPLRELASSGSFRLLPLEHVNDIPGFRTMSLKEEDLPGLVPSEGTLVPATFAILAVRERTPDWFVNECLDSLYGENGLTGQAEGFFTRQAAAAWTDLNYHPAAERYFRAARAEQ